jgi:hypothetical protein
MVDGDLGIGASTSGEAVLAEAARLMNEASAVLIGRRTGHGWSGQLVQGQAGGPASVEFDWAWVLAREEEQGDVVGFYHTHPGGSVAPSQRDVRTMQAWVSCFDKPLLCLIGGGSVLAAYLFETDEHDGRRIAKVQRSGDVVVVRQL